MMLSERWPLTPLPEPAVEQAPVVRVRESLPTTSMVNGGVDDVGWPAFGLDWVPFPTATSPGTAIRLIWSRR